MANDDADLDEVKQKTKALGEFSLRYPQAGTPGHHVPQEVIMFACQELQEKVWKITQQAYQPWAWHSDASCSHAALRRSSQ